MEQHRGGFHGLYSGVLYEPMERHVSFLSLAACAAFALMTRTVASANVHVCQSPRSIGGWIGGSGDTGYNDIASIMQLEVTTSGESLGWFYRLRNHKIYFQPALGVSRSLTDSGEAKVTMFETVTNGYPAVLVQNTSDASAREGIHVFLRFESLRTADLPDPFKGFVQGTVSTVVIPCQVFVKASY
jgi:hypothetical protein